MTIAQSELEAAEPGDWFTIDHDGLPTSTGRFVSTPNLMPFSDGPDIRVECIQHSDESYDAGSLIVRIDDEEFSGEDARAIANSLLRAADLFTQWADVVETVR